MWGTVGLLTYPVVPLAVTELVVPVVVLLILLIAEHDRASG